MWKLTLRTTLVRFNYKISLLIANLATTLQNFKKETNIKLSLYKHILHNVHKFSTTFGVILRLICCDVQ
jgi:hypothetical protein